jgi:uncharacterized protein YdgA (DUF945 family)
LKKSILAVAVAGALLAQQPVRASGPALPLPEPFQSKAVKVLFDASRELNVIAYNERDVNKKLDAYSKFEFSDALKPRLLEVFGTDHPLTVERLPAPKGQNNYVSRLPAHSYRESDNLDIEWAEFVGNVNTNAAGNRMNFTGTWPSLTVNGKAGKFAVADVAMGSEQVRGADGIWYGPVTVTIASVTAPVDGNNSIRMEDVRMKSELIQRGKSADLHYGFSVNAMTFGAERVERLNTAFRVINMPGQAMEKLKRDMAKSVNAKLTPAEQHSMNLEKMKAFGKALFKGGVSVMIDDISAAYRGNVASLKGRIDFLKMTDKESAAPDGFMKKILLHVDVRVPLAMLSDVSHAVAARSVKADAPDAQKQIDSSAKGFVDLAVGKLVGGGYAKLEEGELRSAIDLKSGKLTFNGKALETAPRRVPAGTKPVQQPAPVTAPKPVPADN